MPNTAMPYHESWQLDVKKAAGFVQEGGVEGLVVEGGAFVGIASAARAFAAPKRAAPARKATQRPSFATRTPRKADIAFIKLTRQSSAPQGQRFSRTLAPMNTGSTRAN